MKSEASVAVLITQKPVAPNQPPTPATGRNAYGTDGFDGDLRDALASTVVREASFTEFRQVLAQFLGHLHGTPV